MPTNPQRRVNMKDLPPEFFLPPPTEAGLWRETAALLLGSLGFVIILAIIVALTQGIVLKV